MCGGGHDFVGPLPLDVGGCAQVHLAIAAAVGFEALLHADGPNDPRGEAPVDDGERQEDDRAHHHRGQGNVQEEKRKAKRDGPD